MYPLATPGAMAGMFLPVRTATLHGPTHETNAVLSTAFDSG